MIKQELQSWLHQGIKKLNENSFLGVRFYIYEEISESFSVSHDQILEKETGVEYNYFVEAGKKGKRCYTYFNQMMNVDELLAQMEISYQGATRDYEYCSYNRKAFYKGEHQFSYTKDQITQLLLETMEVAAIQSPLVTVSECNVEFMKQIVYLIDEEDNCICDCNESMSGRIGIIARSGLDVATAWGNQIFEEISSEKMHILMKQTVTRALGGLNASSMQSGKYRAILSNHVYAELLEAYLPSLFSDMIQDQMSPYCNRLGERIACEEMQLCEDPKHPLGRCKRVVDDEGYLVQKKELVQNGKLVSFLYNKETAAKENLESTGNGFKMSLTADVGVQYTNIICSSKIGNQMDVLVQKLGTGVFVREVDGVFAGVNVHNGDFSLIAKGSIVKEGQLLNSFCDVTIAGNFYQMLKEIEGFGKDFCCTPKGYGSVITPSILVNELTISGI